MQSRIAHPLNIRLRARLSFGGQADDITLFSARKVQILGIQGHRRDFIKGHQVRATACPDRTAPCNILIAAAFRIALQLNPVYRILVQSPSGTYRTCLRLLGRVGVTGSRPPDYALHGSSIEGDAKRKFFSLDSVAINYTASEVQARETVAAIEHFGTRAIAVQADVSKVADIERLFATTIESHGRVDIVVANAGIELVGVPIADVTEAEYDRVFGVNARGAFFTLRSAARHITDNGRIIYVGSSSTAFPRPGYALYNGSKMAPILFAEVLAKELGPEALRSTRSCRPSSQVQGFRPTM